MKKIIEEYFGLKLSLKLFINKLKRVKLTGMKIIFV